MSIEPFTGTLGSPDHLAWMKECEGLNRKASARFARRQSQLGRPVPKRIPPDSRPAPWLYDNEEFEAGDA